MRLQSGLGKAKNISRGDLDNYGKIILGKVVKFNNRDSTADVMLLDGTYVGKDDGEDKAINCLRISDYSGFNMDEGVSYGSVKPLRKGDMVLVAYVDSDKHRPVILGSVARTDYTLTNHPELEAKGEFEDDVDEHYSVNHLQDFNYANGKGEFEKYHHSGAYIAAKKEKMSDHRENAFNVEDLSMKDKWTYKTVKNKDIDFEPFNFLFTTRNKEDEKDEETTYHRFYHDAEKAVTRFSQDGKNHLFYLELDDNFKVQYNLTANRRPKTDKELDIYDHKTLRKSDHDFLYPKPPREDIPEFQKINDFARFEIGKDGEVSLKVQKGNSVTEVKLNDGKLDVMATGEINILSDTRINILAPKIYIHEESPTLNIKEVDPENEWKLEWIDPSQANGDGV